MDTEKFFVEFQDHLAPKLDVYEQAIYLYLIRHSRLIGKEETTVGFKSARKKLAFGIGKAGTAPSEQVCYRKVESLKSKGYIKVVGTEWKGKRIQPYLPCEIPDLIKVGETQPSLTLEEMDFFNVPDNKLLILKREDFKCFYCLAKLNIDIDNSNYVIEHIVSRPEGNNSYRNLVAACRECNNRKLSSKAEDYLRTIYREGTLNQTELKEGLSKLERLKKGELKPAL